MSAADTTTPLERLARSSLDQPVPDGVTAMVDHLRKEMSGVSAIIAYGSCLRGTAVSDTLIDLYVLVDRDEHVSRNALARAAARLVPPNVYYAQHHSGSEVVRCKYAVMTIAAFARAMRRDVSNPYFWARFSQPARLVYQASETDRHTAISAVASAIDTTYAAARASAPSSADALAVWEHGFTETYRTELRPESGARAGQIVAANADFYREAARILAASPPLALNWKRIRVTGKLLSLLRLAKAAFTFEGGADYAAWKIERHTGRKIAVTDWQRRHPFIAGLMLLPSLLRSRVLR